MSSKRKLLSLCRLTGACSGRAYEVACLVGLPSGQIVTCEEGPALCPPCSSTPAPRYDSGQSGFRRS